MCGSREIVSSKTATPLTNSATEITIQTHGAPADAKETAIVCLSAALLFASLAVLALATER
jgi:hypothetical protein